MEVCKFVGCLPSELYKRHNPTVGDFLAVSAYYGVLQEEENERIRSIMGGLR